jgi:hypothetical protein
MARASRTSANLETGSAMNFPHLRRILIGSGKQAAEWLSIGMTQRTPERAGAMSSALCEEAVERIADEQKPLNKKADAPRAHAGENRPYEDH